MPQTVISVENVSKSYQLGSIGTGTLRGDMQRWWAKFRGLPDPSLKVDEPEQQKLEGGTLWALKDINFSVQQGEALGIIGRNGAGKSTLLKILSEVTAPNSGEIKIKGRIASLLEVGTGFHPELTGRENIYLNGAINGMNKADIRGKFGEIVDFSGVEKFIDTPVKRYSSGMYVRLAFAVAAHLEPEILIVDEVLAVGDAEFQRKCLGRMGDVAHEGRTILFVSHNMGAIESLCQRCMWLENGQIKTSSNDVSDVISQYLQSSIWNSSSKTQNTGISTKYFKVRKFEIRNSKNENSELFLKSENVTIGLDIDLLENNPGLNIGYAIYEKEKNICLWWSFCKDSEDFIIDIGLRNLKTIIPAGTLNDGEYRIEFIAAIHNQNWIIAPGQNTANLEFTVSGGSVGAALAATTTRPGLLFPIFPWEHE